MWLTASEVTWLPGCSLLEGVRDPAPDERHLGVADADDSGDPKSS